MEVLYYFICSVKDNVPFILSNRANEIIQYLHNMVAVHPATSGLILNIFNLFKPRVTSIKILRIKSLTWGTIFLRQERYPQVRKKYPKNE